MRACTHARMHAHTHTHIHTHRTAFSQAKGAPKRDQEDKTLSRAGAREWGGGERTSVDGARAPASVSPIALPSSTAVAHLKRSWSSSAVHGFPLRAHASMAASPSPGASVTTRSSPTLGASELFSDGVGGSEDGWGAAKEDVWEGGAAAMEEEVEAAVNMAWMGWGMPKCVCVCVACVCVCVCLGLCGSLASPSLCLSVCLLDAIQALCVCLYIRTHTHTNTHTHKYVCMYVCVCVYIYTVDARSKAT